MKNFWIIALLLPFLAACSGKSAEKEPGFIVQVSLGGWDHPHYPAEKIIDRLEDVGNKINIEKVIIGWSLDDATYLKLGEYLHAKGIQMLLWLPVFAETEEVCDNKQALDLWGNVPSDFHLVKGEGFRFTCPTSPENVAHIIALYEDYFSDCGFDGVFMDRIRTQSFVSGVSGVLNCCCDECAAHFREPSCHVLRDLVLRSDRIACKEAAACSYSSLSDRFCSFHEYSFCHIDLLSYLHTSIADSGQIWAHIAHPMQSSGLAEVA